jgi:TRAP-type mannitol/chloroaromatic compound transport system permease small subunit
MKHTSAVVLPNRDPRAFDLLKAAVEDSHPDDVNLQPLSTDYVPFERNTGMLAKIVDTIDAFNIKQGEVSSLLAIPLLLVVVYEVVMRYVFNAPTTWGFEATTFLYGVHYMLGLAYCDVHGGHVRVDIFTARLPQRPQSIIGILTNLVFFMPVMVLMTIATWKYALTSIAELELNPTSWAPPIYPIKTLMAIAFSFLLIQGFSNLIHNIRVLQGKAEGVR